MAPTRAPRNLIDIQSKVSSRTTTNPGMNKIDQQKLFRERRKAREEEQLRKQREARLQRSAQAQAAAAGPALRPVCPNAKVSARSALLSASVPTKAPPATGPALRPVHANARVSARNARPSSSVPSKAPPAMRQPEPLQRKQNPSVKRALDMGEGTSAPSKPGRSRKSASFPTKRSSNFKRKVHDVPTNKSKAPSNVIKGTLKAIRHTKASELRLIRGNASVEIAYHTEGLLKSNSCFTRLTKDAATSQLRFLKERAAAESQRKKRKSVLNSSNHKVVVMNKIDVQVAPIPKSKTPSKIPVKKTSFMNLKESPVRTPKPSSLREKLCTWLEDHGQSVNNYRHLSCFGITGSAVKRPKTPYRKSVMSTSSLLAIPESKESLPASDTSGSDVDDTLVLDTTFTVEEENKENILCIGSVSQKKQPTQVFPADENDSLDKAHGVLSELLKLLKMGYPSDQVNLWLRAVRRRFPQCGDEVVYWECLAALEESRGDLRTAVACYERAIAQGGEESLQTALEDLRMKLIDLNIDAGSDEVPSSSTLCRGGLNPSNVIWSSAIKFHVQEKPFSKMDDGECSTQPESMFTATPVRRSTRSSVKSTRRESCVASLDHLQPNVRKSLVFRSNSALDP